MAGRGLKDYLQRYVNNPLDGADGGKAKKKKKSKGNSGGGGNAGSGVIIVDDDATWHREVQEEEEDELDEDGEGPQVIEDVEVKRMHKMEALKTHRPYLSMANDGSGWVTVMDDKAPGGGSGDDNSAPRSPLEGNSSDLSAKRKRSDSPDLSPSKQRKHSRDLSPPRRMNDSNLSPPRRRRDSTDLSPPRRRNDSTDLSSPRRRTGSPNLSYPMKRKGSPDLFPTRRRRDSPQDESLSLSSMRKRMDSPDSSPPRRRKVSPDPAFGRRNSSRIEEDLAPPRRSKFSGGGSKVERRDSSPRRRKDSLDLSPHRRKHDSPIGQPRDISTKRKGDNSPDLSPPRRRKGSVDLSPRRSKISTGDSSLEHRDPPRRSDSPDLSAPRGRRDSLDLPLARKLGSKDLSPPRNPQNLTSTKQNRSQDLSPPRKKGNARMSDGTFAGLKSEKEVVSEAERKRAAEAKMLSELDPSLSGRGAKTVFRDKRGKRLEGLEEMLRQQRGEVKPAEQPLEWGKGLAQKKVAEANFAELEAEKSRPFARYRDDAELDKSLKERLRWGDPMAHLVKQKNGEPVLEDLGAREEMKASGFIVPQEIPKHSWLKRGIAPPPNRYDIRPGRHWDGVDRSTGHEQGLFKSKNEKKARDLEAYLWSVSDM
ncbi:unnamed protein product [Calypogeia fissa]